MRIFQTLVSLVIMLMTLYFLDGFAAKKVTASLTADDSPIYNRVNIEDIDWDGPDIQSCNFDWVWGLYPYQTCYVRVPSAANPDINVFIYIFTGPPQIISLPWDLLGGRTPGSYRFALPVRVESRCVLYPDGTIRDKRDANGCGKN